jgi:HEAT repeat protein
MSKRVCWLIVALLAIDILLRLIPFPKPGSAVNSGSPPNRPITDMPALLHDFVSSHDMATQLRAADELRPLVSQPGGLYWMVGLLANANPETRQEAAVYLGFRIRGGLSYRYEPTLLDAILTATSDSETEVQTAACNVLVDISLVETYYGREDQFGQDSQRVVETVTKLLTDDSNDVRVKASTTLGFIGYEAAQARPDLESLLFDSQFPVRLAAAFALIRLSSVSPEIIQIVQEGFAYTVPEIERPVLPNITGDWPSSIPRESAAALGMIGPPAKDAVPLLINLLKDADLKTRETALESVLLIDPDGGLAIPLLMEALKSSDQTMRVNAARALGLYGSKAESALPLLNELIAGNDLALSSYVAEAIRLIRAE